ncbi:MAG: GAF domain-containing protein, partial [Desulfarculaceae bacterium]
SSNSEQYPIGSSKDMTESEWAQAVIGEKKIFLVNDKQHFKKVFFDHAKLDALGCGSCLSFPVLFNGQCLGAVNLVNVENWFNQNHIDVGAHLIPYLTPALITSKQ